MNEYLYAIIFDREEKFAQLLKSVPVDIHENKEHLLREACVYGRLGIVQMLTERGADVQAMENRPLIDACRGGHQSVVEHLLALGANIHDQDDEALISACHGSHENIIHLLLANGANVYAQKNALIVYACNHGKLKILERIFSGHKPLVKDVNAKLPHTSLMPIEVAPHALTISSVQLSVIKFFLKNGSKLPAMEMICLEDVEIYIYLKSWATYKCSRFTFAQKLWRAKARVAESSNLFEVLDPSGVNTDDWEKITTLYLAGVDLSKQDGFLEQGIELAIKNYVTKIREELTRFLLPVLVSIILTF